MSSWTRRSAASGFSAGASSACMNTRWKTPSTARSSSARKPPRRPDIPAPLPKSKRRPYKKWNRPSELTSDERFLSLSGGKRAPIQIQGGTAQFGKRIRREIFRQGKVWKAKECFVYPQRACPHPYGSFVANGCDIFPLFRTVGLAEKIRRPRSGFYSEVPCI